MSRQIPVRQLILVQWWLPKTGVNGWSCRSSRKLIAARRRFRARLPALQPLTSRQTPQHRRLVFLVSPTSRSSSTLRVPLVVLDHILSSAPNITMSSTRIYHNISRIPITSTIVLIFGNYELWRIHKGTHPYWSPKFEQAGLTIPRNKTNSGTSDNGATGTRVEAGRESRGVSIQFMNLNGVPIPFLGPKSME
jgi:hypothetical protein